MLMNVISTALAVTAVAVPTWLGGPGENYALPPLTYRLAAAPVPDGVPWTLAEDDAGDGRRVAVLGNLAAAEHVAVIVPGATQDLTTFDTPLGPLGHARTLLAELTRRAPTTPVAVIAWLGYDAPEGIGREAARSDRAAAGAPELARLDGVLPDGAHVTWLCHSYGTVVCGRASQLTPPEDLVLLASPGTDADTAAELGARQVWAARADGDAIRFTPFVRIGNAGHGPDPMDAGFGARVLDAGPARGHSEYFAADGTLLGDLATVVLGGTPERGRG
jgi:hypothetical protein